MPLILTTYGAAWFVLVLVVLGVTWGGVPTPSFHLKLVVSSPGPCFCSALRRTGDSAESSVFTPSLREFWDLERVQSF